MKKVFIKYNPYKLETEITVDGRELKKNSVIREKSAKDNRMQDWIEELPDLLKKEYNDAEFDITFQGTDPDFDDLVEIMQMENQQGKLKYQLEHKEMKGTGDKDKLIADLFQTIKRGPFEDFVHVRSRMPFIRLRVRTFQSV